MITIKLTVKQYDILWEAIHAYQDRGPCCGEGWCSPEVDEVRKIVAEAASPTVEATVSNADQ